ncbi:hypothetical protein Tco_1278511 [Tanacetum coccineum]
MARRVDHSFVDTVDTRVRDTERRTMAAIEEAQEDRASVRAEIEILRRERLAYEQESIETRQALASNVMRMSYESGADDEDYVNRALIHYQAENRNTFKYRHCWEVLKDSLKWKTQELPKFATET